MFYKIDPKQAQVGFDLTADDFLLGDRIWVHLEGDFQPTPKGSRATDTFSNTSFEIGSRDFDADPAAVLKMRDTTLVAINHDDPLGDNTDPDNDYGVQVKLEMFTDGGDHFSFRHRDALPDVHGSRYKSGAGNDVIVMPDTKVQGFNTDKTFSTGAGNDRVKAGDLDLKLAFGDGTDTFVVKDASVNWGNKENRDNDDKIVIKTDDGRHQVVNAEILKDGGDKDPLVKWYFNLARDDDGGLTVKFFENGKLVASDHGFYDEALPTQTGEFEAIFRKGGGLGERIELSGVNGFDGITLHQGTDGGDAETDFVASKAFLKTVFNHIGDAYDLTGQPAPWDHGHLEPLVPVTVAIRGKVGQPFLKAARSRHRRPGQHHRAPAVRAEARRRHSGHGVQGRRGLLQGRRQRHEGQGLALQGGEGLRRRRLRRRDPAARQRCARQHDLLGHAEAGPRVGGGADQDRGRPQERGVREDQGQGGRHRRVEGRELRSRTLPPVRRAGQ